MKIEKKICMQNTKSVRIKIYFFIITSKIKIIYNFNLYIKVNNIDFDRIIYKN